VDLSKIQRERFVVRVEFLSNEGSVGQTSGRCEVSVIATETSRAKNVLEMAHLRIEEPHFTLFVIFPRGVFEFVFRNI